MLVKILLRGVDDPWPFSDSATVAAALFIWFWLGFVLGMMGVKGGLL